MKTFLKIIAVLAVAAGAAAALCLALRSQKAATYIELDNDGEE